jgi:hypothetical protein
MEGTDGRRASRSEEWMDARLVCVSLWDLSPIAPGGAVDASIVDFCGRGSRGQVSGHKEPGRPGLTTLVAPESGDSSI